MFDTNMDKVCVRTLGGFDLYYRRELVRFSSSRTKELLTVLADWRDKAVTLAHLAGILSEGGRGEVAVKQAVHLAWHRLKQTPKKYGIEKIVIKEKGTYAVNKEQIVCDSYDMVRQIEGASNYFADEYVPEHSWVKTALSSFMRDYFEEEFQGNSKSNVQKGKQ